MLASEMPVPISRLPTVEDSGRHLRVQGGAADAMDGGMRARERYRYHTHAGIQGARVTALCVCSKVQAPRFFVIYDSQFPLASSRFGRDSIQYRVGKTHCQGHQDPSKTRRVPIFLGTPEANLKMVPICRVPISRLPTVVFFGSLRHILE